MVPVNSNSSGDLYLKTILFYMACLESIVFYHSRIWHSIRLLDVYGPWSKKLLEKIGFLPILIIYELGEGLVINGSLLWNEQSHEE